MTPTAHLIPAALTVILALGCPLPARADAALAGKKGCIACHGIDARKIPIYPSYAEIRARYAGDKTAADKLVQKVLNGGANSFGTAPMPAQKGVLNEAEARKLVGWILSGK